MSDNWVVQNLENALNTWNEKLAEIWTIITQSPENFKGGTIWNVIVGIHGALQAIGLALALFLAMAHLLTKKRLGGLHLQASLLLRRFQIKGNLSHSAYHITLLHSIVHRMCWE